MSIKEERVGPLGCCPTHECLSVVSGIAALAEWPQIKDMSCFVISALVPLIRQASCVQAAGHSKYLGDATVPCHPLLFFLLLQAPLAINVFTRQPTIASAGQLARDGGFSSKKAGSHGLGCGQSPVGHFTGGLSSVKGQ